MTDMAMDTTIIDFPIGKDTQSKDKRDMHTVKKDGDWHTVMTGHLFMTGKVSFMAILINTDTTLKMYFTNTTDTTTIETG